MEAFLGDVDEGYSSLSTVIEPSLLNDSRVESGRLRDADGRFKRLSEPFLPCPLETDLVSLALLSNESVFKDELELFCRN